MKNMTVVRVSVLYFCLVTGLGPLAAIAQETQVDVKADSLQIESKQKTARFLGNVQAVFDDLQFFCNQMTVVYNEKGAIVSLTAEGNITVTKNGAKATAQRARMDMGRRTLILSGQPKLTRDGNTLTGNTIEVNLQSGKIIVTEAVGTFIFPTGTLK